MIEEPKKNIWERHFQTIMLTISIMVLGWSGKTTLEASKQIEVLNTTLGYVQAGLKELKEDVKYATRDRYTSADADRDLREVRRRLDHLEKMTEGFDERLRAHVETDYKKIQ